LAAAFVKTFLKFTSYLIGCLYHDRGISLPMESIKLNLCPKGGLDLQIKKTWHGVKVEVTHHGSMRRKYRVSGLTKLATNELVYVVS